MSTKILKQSSLPPHTLNKEAQEAMLAEHTRKILEIHSILKIMSDALRENPEWIKMMHAKKEEQIRVKLQLGYFFVQQPDLLIISYNTRSKKCILEQTTGPAELPNKTNSPLSITVFSSNDSEEKIRELASTFFISVSLWEFIQSFKNTGDSTTSAVYQYLHDFAKSREKEIKKASQ